MEFKTASITFPDIKEALRLLNCFYIYLSPLKRDLADLYRGTARLHHEGVSSFGRSHIPNTATGIHNPKELSLSDRKL